MAVVRIAPLDPLQHNAAIVDQKGYPTPLFMQQWAKSREVSLVVDETASDVVDVTEDLAGNYYTKTQSDATFETQAHAAATFSEIGHTHTFADITAKPTTLAGYGIVDAAPLAHTHDWADITGEPATFPPSAHTHAWADVTGEPTTLAGYGIVDAAPLVHTHTTADITSGVFAVARLATGTPDGTKFLRDDGTWAAATPGAHTHTAAEITSLTFADARIAASNVTQHQAALSIGWGQLTSVPGTFTPSAHNHAAADVNSGTFNDARIAASNVTQHQAALSIAWGQLTSVPATFAPSAHTHPWADVTGEPTTLAGYGIVDAAPLVHVHDTADITTGTFVSARLSGSYTGITLVGTLTSLAVSGTLGISGLTTFTGTGKRSDTSGAGTSAVYHQLTSTGGGGLFGLESSAGGAIFTGGTAYATVLGAFVSGTVLQFATQSIVRVTIENAGHVKMTKNLYIGDGVTHGTARTELVLGGTSSGSTLAFGKSGTVYAELQLGSGSPPNLFFQSLTGGGSIGFLTTDAQPIDVYTTNTKRWSFTATGHFTTGLDNVYDIGASSTTFRPRDVHVGRNITLGGNVIGQLKTTTLNFGTSPKAQAIFTVTDASVSATSKIAVFVGGDVPSGWPANATDEWEMDPAVFTVVPGTGQFTLNVGVRTFPGIVGTRNVNYVVS